MSIDRQQAASALSEIDAIVRRVRQSRIYNFSSLMLIMWGALVFAGYVASYIWPGMNGVQWIVLNAIGLAASLAIGASTRQRAGVNTFSARFLAAFVLFASLDAPRSRQFHPEAGGPWRAKRDAALHAL